MTFNASTHGLTGRDPVVASHAMLSSGHPLATEAGLQVLRNGGNAFDAVVCAAAVIAVLSQALITSVATSSPSASPHRQTSKQSVQAGHLPNK